MIESKSATKRIPKEELPKPRDPVRATKPLRAVNAPRTAPITMPRIPYSLAPVIPPPVSEHIPTLPTAEISKGEAFQMPKPELSTYSVGLMESKTPKPSKQ